MEKDIKNEKSLYILKWIIIGVLSFAAAVFIFGLGIWVGQERAEFSFRWAENYHNNFGGPRNGLMNNFPAMDYTNGHGLFGTIEKIDTDTLVVEDKDNIEKTVVISDKTTTIRNKSGIIKLSDLKIGDNLVIIGDPDAGGKIDAKFVRVLPAMPSSIIKNNINNI